MTPPAFAPHAPDVVRPLGSGGIASASERSVVTVANEWILSFADVATHGADLALSETYPTYEAAAAAFLLDHLPEFAHPVQITTLAPGRWLLKHLDGREQPMDFVRIDETSPPATGSRDV